LSVFTVGYKVAVTKEKIQLRLELILYFAFEPFGEKGMGKSDGHPLFFFFVFEVKRIEPTFEVALRIGLEKMFAKGLFHVV